MRLLVIIFAALSVHAPIAFARIGETQAQIRDRFGPSIRGRADTRMYKKGGFMILVVYENGVSIAEFVCKEIVEDKQYESLTEWKSGEAFTPQEIETLLAIYSQGSTWIRAGDEQKWLRGDSVLSAIMVRGMPTEDDSNMSEQERDAFRRTPALFFASAAYIKRITSQQNVEKTNAEAERKRIETQEVVDAFGPIPPARSTPTPNPWKTPLPPYPAQARVSHVEGATTVKITTDASGNVTSCLIVKSAGSSILDSNTQIYARNNWKGAPNSTYEYTFEYRLH